MPCIAASLIVLNLNPIGVDEAAAIGMEATPSLRVDEVWDSNVLYTSGNNTVSSFGTRVTPALDMRFFPGEESNFRLRGSYSQNWYNDPEAKGGESSTIHVRLDSPEGVRFSPNWSLNPSGYYTHTTDAYSRIELLPSGDPVLPPATITNYGFTRTEDLGAAATARYKATPKLQFALNGSYATLGFSGLSSSMRIGGIASAEYDYSQRTTLGIVAAGNRQTYQSQPDSYTVSGGLRHDFEFSPVLRSHLVVGISYIRQEGNAGQAANSNYSPSGLFRVSYLSETLSVNFYGSALFSGFGYGEPRRQGTVGLNMNQRIAVDWSWYLSGSYQVSRSVFGSNTDYLHAMYGSAGISYRPWDWGRLTLSGNWNHQTAGGQTGSGLTDYSVLLGLTLEKPYIVF